MARIGQRSRRTNAIAEAKRYAIDYYDLGAQGHIRKGNYGRGFLLWSAKQLAKAGPESWEELAIDVASLGQGGLVSRGLRYAGKKLGTKAAGKTLIWIGEKYGGKLGSYAWRAPRKAYRIVSRYLGGTGNPMLDAARAGGSMEGIIAEAKASNTRARLGRDASLAEDIAYEARRKAEAQADHIAPKESGRLLGPKYTGGRRYGFTVRDKPGVTEGPGTKVFEGTEITAHRKGSPKWTPYVPGTVSRDYWTLSLPERRLINARVDKIFEKQTGLTRKLETANPHDKPYERLWLRIRDQVMREQASAARSRPGAIGTHGDRSSLMGDAYYRVKTQPYSPRARPAPIPRTIDVQQYIRDMARAYRG